jgi:ADP-heptose:LPS heptosyltransferase
MRALDFWVGIPLTFFLTAIDRALRLVGLAASPAGGPRNILFIQLAEMGTMVVAYPSLQKARELFPDATLHFLCFTQIRSSVEMLEIIPAKNIVTIDADSIPSFVRDTWPLPARAPAPHRHGDRHGGICQVQQRAELSIGRPATRRLPPLQSGRAVHRGSAHT